MATFELSGPDGGTYQIDAPDETAALGAFHAMNGTPAPVGVGEDMAKTALPSTGRMAAGMAGLPGDLSNLLAKGSQAASDYVAGKLGIDPGPRAAPPVLPTSDSLQKKIEPYTGDYQPQTAPGQILDKAIQFAPGLIGGPETLLAKGLTRVAAPALASEAAGKLTEGTAAQPYAELGGALVGAGGASAGLSKLNAMSAARGALPPTLAETKAASRALYQHPDVAAVQIKPDVVEGLAGTIEKDLQHGTNSGFRAANEPKVFSAVDELRTAANEGRPATVADLDNVRQVLGNAAKEKDAIGQPTRQAAAASRAIDHIDNFLPSLKQPDLLAGDATKANSILEDARANWAAYKKSSTVQTNLANAQLNAAAANSGGNIQNATKQAFKPLLKNNGAKVASWSDDEQTALNKIVRGTWTGTAARAAGNLLGGGGGLGMLAGGAAGYEAGGVPGAIAAGLAGRAFKAIGNRSTFNAVQKLDTLIRSKSPEALRIAAQNPQLATVLPAKSIRLLRTMILSEPALRSQNQQRDPVGSANAQ